LSASRITEHQKDSAPMRTSTRFSALTAIATAVAVALSAFVTVSPATAAVPGTAVLWGYTSSTSDSEFAAAVEGKKVLSAGVGVDGGVALLSDHSLAIWGTTDYGLHTAPTIPASRHVVQVAAGYFTYYALLDNGRVLGWGKGLSSNSEFTAINASGTVTQLSALGDLALALYSDGSVRGWKTAGGDYSNVISGTAAATAANDFIAVATGISFGMALHEDGTVMAWGTAGAGGDGDDIGAGGSPIIAIAAGPNHAVALRESGEVLSWGQEQQHELSGISGGLDGHSATAVCASIGQTLLVRDDGVVVSVGFDESPSVTDAPAAIGDTFVGSIYCGYEAGIAVAAVPKLSLTRSGSPVANASIARGDTVDLSGSKLTRNSTFSVLFDGDEVATGTADSAGAFASIPIEVPTSATLGTHHLVFQSADYTFDTKFTVGGALPVPALSGTLRVGQMLTAAPGTWTAGTTFTYAWLRDGKTISGASSATYELAPADRSHAIQVKVTGTRGASSSTATSAKTGKIGYGTLSSDLPQISGTARVGETLAIDPGTWSPTPGFAYQWYSNGSAISKATKSTLVVPSSALGRRISVRLVATSSGYTSATRISYPTSVVDEGTMAPGSITFSSPVQVGKPVKATLAGWTTGATFTYQWSDGSGPIYGATKSSYTPRADQRNDALYVEVTAFKPGFAGTYLSQLAGPIYGTFSAATPKVSGSPKVGQVLTAVPGTWSPTASFGYSWVRVRGATSVEVGTSSSYALTVDDKGAKIVLKITGTTSNYVPLTVSSKATTTVS
jgi:hypothetical protein